jgi:hypothetical protein
MSGYVYLFTVVTIWSDPCTPSSSMTVGLNTKLIDFVTFGAKKVCKKPTAWTSPSQGFARKNHQEVLRKTRYYTSLAENEKGAKAAG